MSIKRLYDIEKNKNLLLQLLLEFNQKTGFSIDEKNLDEVISIEIISRKSIRGNNYDLENTFFDLEKKIKNNIKEKVAENFLNKILSCHEGNDYIDMITEFCDNTEENHLEGVISNLENSLIELRKIHPMPGKYTKAAK